MVHFWHRFPCKVQENYWQGIGQISRTKCLNNSSFYIKLLCKRIIVSKIPRTLASKKEKFQNKTPSIVLTTRYCKSCCKLQNRQCLWITGGYNVKCHNWPFFRYLGYAYIPKELSQAFLICWKYTDIVTILKSICNSCIFALFRFVWMLNLFNILHY